MSEYRYSKWSDGNERFKSKRVAAGKKMGQLKYPRTKGDNLFIEVNITSFQTGESLKSPYVSGARRIDARTMPRLNKPFYIKGSKRGTSGTFGKKNGYGGMVF